MLHHVSRQYAPAQQLVAFVRSLAPKLEVPVQPPPMSAKSSIPLLIEERRKFIQAYANVAIGNTTSCMLREVRDFVGYTEYLKVKDEDALQPRVQLKHVVSNTNTSSGNNNDSFSSAPRNSMRNRNDDDDKDSVTGSEAAPFSPAAAARRRSSVQQLPSMSPTPSSDSKLKPASDSSSSPVADKIDNVVSLDECFRVIDEGGAGYITFEDMSAFAAALPNPVVTQWLMRQRWIFSQEVTC